MEIIQNSRVNELNKFGIFNSAKVDNHIKQHENAFTTSETSKTHVFKKKKILLLFTLLSCGSGEKAHVFLFMDESGDSFCETYRLCSVMESVPEAWAHWKQSVW